VVVIFGNKSARNLSIFARASGQRVIGLAMPKSDFASGRYPVIPYLKCYYDTIFKISKYKWQKNLKQNFGCSQDISLQSLEVLEPNSKSTERNKKDK
jgi:hypothetical protein